MFLECRLRKWSALFFVMKTDGSTERIRSYKKSVKLPGKRLIFIEKRVK